MAAGEHGIRTVAVPGAVGAGSVFEPGSVTAQRKGDASHL